MGVLSPGETVVILDKIALFHNKMELVEAAGVEPASEKVHRDKATCVSGSLFFDRLMRNRQEGNGLARLISALRLRAEALNLSC